MKGSEGWQVSGDAAEVYEQCFVPAIFGRWAPHMVDASRVTSGDRVLDVGCGTGGAWPGRLQIGSPRKVRSLVWIATWECWRWRAASDRKSTGAKGMPRYCPLRTPAMMSS